jgi:hypothetical protein
MKKIPVIALLVPLVLFEIYLCTAFLPLRWQRATNNRIADVLPKSYDSTPGTHPLLSQEIEQVLREHTGLKMALCALILALLAGNSWLIWFVWRLQRPREGNLKNGLDI